VQKNENAPPREHTAIECTGVHCRGRVPRRLPHETDPAQADTDEKYPDTDEKDDGSAERTTHEHIKEAMKSLLGDWNENHVFRARQAYSREGALSRCVHLQVTHHVGAVCKSPFHSEMMFEIAPGVYILGVDLMHGQLRVGTVILKYCLSDLCVKIGAVPTDPLLIYLMSMRYGAMAKAVLKHVKDKKTNIEDALGGTCKIIARDVVRLDDAGGFLFWIPKHFTRSEADLDVSQIREVGAFLFFYSRYKSWLRILFYEAPKVKSEHCMHEVVLRWIRQAMMVYHVLVRINARWLVRPCIVRTATAALVMQVNCVYTSKIFMVLAAQLSNNIRYQDGRGVFDSLGEWVECLMAAVNRVNQNGKGNQAENALFAIHDNLEYVLKANMNKERKAYYTFDQPMRDLWKQSEHAAAVKAHWRAAGWTQTVDFCEAFEESGMDEDGKIHWAPYLVQERAKLRAQADKQRCVCTFTARSLCSVV